MASLWVEQNFITIGLIIDASNVRAASLLLDGQATSWLKNTMKRSQRFETCSDLGKKPPRGIFAGTLPTNMVRCSCSACCSGVSCMHHV
eukprot:1159311-Pelagomonas_calceolata.AAC.7